MSAISYGGIRHGKRRYDLMLESVREMIAVLPKSQGRRKVSARTAEASEAIVVGGGGSLLDRALARVLVLH
jgi:hypothetical protein